LGTKLKQEGEGKNRTEESVGTELFQLRMETGLETRRDDSPALRGQWSSA